MPRALPKLALCIFLSAPMAAAVDFNVVVTGDLVDPSPGDGVCGAFDGTFCSLRSAIQEANATPGIDTVYLPPGTYPLTWDGDGEDAGATGDLDVTEDLYIVGPDPAEGAVLIDASELSDRVFHMHSGANLIVSNLTIQGGFTGGKGGAFYNKGVLLFLTQVTLRDNTAGSGTAVYNEYGTNLILQSSTVEGNTGGSNDGAIHSVAGALVNVQESTLSGNDGYQIRAGGVINIRNSTIVGNQGTQAIRYSGLDVLDAELTFIRSLIVGGCDIASGTVTSDGGNLESPGDTCSLDPINDQLSVADAKLQPLGFYGGPTATHRPLPTSPAVDDLRTPVGSCTINDQRGFSRPRDGDGNGIALCDVGAVELLQGELGGWIFGDGFDDGSAADWSSSSP